MLIAIGTILVIWAIWLAVYDRRNFFLPYMLALGSVFMLIGFLLYPASAQEHRHPPQDAEIHHRFYKTWMMPDNRGVSCCHDEDCAPAQSKFESGKWYAMRDGEWIEIPNQKIETERDPPDARSHLCGRRYGFNNNQFSVFCFIAGSGS